MKPDRIEEIVSEVYKTPVNYIKGSDQLVEYNEPRSIMYFFIERFTDLEIPHIGDRFNRPSRNVINGIRNVQDIVRYPEKKFLFKKIQKQILDEEQRETPLSN